MNPTIIAFMKKELTQALRDIRMRMLLFVMPVVQMTIFGLALSTEIKGIRLAAYHAPQDAAARRAGEHFFSSGWFVPADAEKNDPYTLIQSGRADAALIAPPEGLTKALENGRGRLQLLVDATNATKARGIEAYAKSILAKAAMPEFKGPRSPSPVSLDVRILYNPTMESSVFMVPGVMSIILCLITLILTSMSMAREREIGTFETIVSAPVSNREILLGKTLPYILLGLMDAALILAAGRFIFGTPVKGHLWTLGLSSFVFVVTTVSLGTLISTIAKNQQQAMMGSFLFLFPAIQLSGVMFPVENMPEAIIAAAYLNPLKYFVTLLRNIMLKGGDEWVVISNLSVLAAMAAFTAWVAFKRFRQTLN